LSVTAPPDASKDVVVKGDDVGTTTAKHHDTKRPRTSSSAHQGSEFELALSNQYSQQLRAKLANLREKGLTKVVGDEMLDRYRKLGEEPRCVVRKMGMRQLVSARIAIIIVPSVRTSLI
jgi:hypothetical protein